MCASPAQRLVRGKKGVGNYFVLVKTSPQVILYGLKTLHPLQPRAAIALAVAQGEGGERYNNRNAQSAKLSPTAMFDEAVDDTLSHSFPTQKRSNRTLARRPDSYRDWPRKCSGEEMFRTEIGLTFLLHFFCQEKKRKGNVRYTVAISKQRKD